MGFFVGGCGGGGSAVRVAVRVGVLRQEVGLLPGGVAAAGGRCGLEPGVGSSPTTTTACHHQRQCSQPSSHPAKRSSPEEEMAASEAQQQL